jgi:predicted PurR-regulated permease PerM
VHNQTSDMHDLIVLVLFFAIICWFLFFFLFLKKNSSFLFSIYICCINSNFMNCVTELYIHVILALIILYLLCNWIIKMNFFLVMPKVFSSANYLRPSSPLLRVWDNSFFDINQQSYQWDTTSNHHCYENFRPRELASLVIMNSNTIVESWGNF